MRRERALNCFLYLADWRGLRRAAKRRGNSAFRPGTMRNLRSHVLLFAAFADHFGLRDFPATATTLTCFGEFLLRSFQAPKSVFNALSAVKHFHLDYELPTSAFESRRVELWKRAVSITVRHVPMGAPPLPREVLSRLCSLASRLGQWGLVFATLAAVLFFSMARLSSLLPQAGGAFDGTRLPTWADVRGEGGAWAIRIKWAKAHQAASQAFWVPLLAVQGSPSCPVANLQRLRQATWTGEADGPLFQLPPLRSRAGKRAQRVLTMPVAREWLRLLLHRLGLQHKGFTFHSFRRGACTHAYMGGAEVADIQQLGGWRSSAVQRYLPMGEARRRAAQVLSGETKRVN